jgi:hypothetical protein
MTTRGLSLSLHSAAFVFATRARSNDGFFDDDAISLSRERRRKERERERTIANTTD